MDRGFGVDRLAEKVDKGGGKKGKKHAEEKREKVPSRPTVPRSLKETRKRKGEGMQRRGGEKKGRKMAAVALHEKRDVPLVYCQ